MCFVNRLAKRVGFYSHVYKGWFCKKVHVRNKKGGFLFETSLLSNINSYLQTTGLQIRSYLRESNLIDTKTFYTQFNEGN